MAHEEQRRRRRQLCAEYRSEIIQHQSCGACGAAGRGSGHGAAPSALVESDGLNGACGQGGKERVVCVAVIAEAMDED